MPRDPEIRREFIKWLAEVSEGIGFGAGVGASETAGLIVSILYANPQFIEPFMAQGNGLFIDGDIELRAENGALTFMSQRGEVLTPGELVARKHGKGAFQ